MMLCSFPGCDNPASPKAARGLCNSHYWQHHKGRELTPLTYRRNRSVPWIQDHASHVGEECLTWPFKLKADGYGQVRYKGQMMPAHRLMCIVAHGLPPTPEHQAAHSCGKGNRGCVNPQHLRWATPTENAADKIVHGTAPWGERAGAAKLTTSEVMIIRKRAATTPHRALASEFGVNPGTIGKIVHRERWRHI